MMASILLPLFLVFSFLAQAEITADLLEKKTAEKITSVEEFKFIRETAEKMGLRVWLFGGTAAGYIHYVKQDALREQGDKRYQNNGFDYDFTNIYRSTQDLDIVANGTLEQIDELQRRLQNKYPHFLGGKAKWEVRSLRHARGRAGEIGYKEALLDDYDFLNQNTDSNSTGMIEISESKEPVIRDLRDWQSKRCQFFDDVLNGRNHFYRSANHFKTARAKAGNNPEIFSVIRALTKNFQYELTFSAKDNSEIAEIIKKFRPSHIVSDATHYRLIEMGKKLFKNAVNIEYAWNTLESLGLRKKLMEFDSIDKKDSLAWWMNREPLRSFKVGRGNGPTAAHLEIDLIAHETNSFLSYESITRAHTGDPNFLSSRDGAIGERAIYGDGVYAQIGKYGAVGTGITVHLKMNPKARLGTDFIIEGTYVILLNKNAAQVIPEKFEMSLLQYFQRLNAGVVDFSQKALVEKFKRRWSRSTSKVKPSEIEEIRTLVEQELFSHSYHHMTKFPLAAEFFTFPISAGSGDLLTTFLDYKPEDDLTFLGLPQWVKHPKWEKWARRAIETHLVNTGVQILEQPAAVAHPAGPKLAEFLVSTSFEPTKELLHFILTSPLMTNSRNLPKYVAYMYPRVGPVEGAAEAILSNTVIRKSKEWKTLFPLVCRSNNLPEAEILESLMHPDSLKNPVWPELVRELGTIEFVVSRLIYSNPKIPDWKNLYREAIERTSLPHETIFTSTDDQGELIFFQHPDWEKNLQTLLHLDSRPLESMRLLMKPKHLESKDWPRMAEKIVTGFGADSSEEFFGVLTKMVEKDYPEWRHYLMLYLRSVLAINHYTTLKTEKPFAKSFFKHPLVKSDPVLLGINNGKPITEAALTRIATENFDFNVLSSGKPMNCPKLFRKTGRR